MIVPPGLHLRPIVFFLIFYLLLWLLLLRLLLLLLLLLPPTLHILPFLHSLPHPLIVLVLLFSSFVVVFFIIFILFSVYTFVSQRLFHAYLYFITVEFIYLIFMWWRILVFILYLRLEFLFFVWCLYSLSVFISSFSLIPYRVRFLCLVCRFTLRAVLCSLAITWGECEKGDERRKR